MAGGLHKDFSIVRTESELEPHFRITILFDSPEALEEAERAAALVEMRLEHAPTEYARFDASQLNSTTLQPSLAQAADSDLVIVALNHLTPSLPAWIAGLEKIGNRRGGALAALLDPTVGAEQGLFERLRKTAKTAGMEFFCRAGGPEHSEIYALAD